MATTRKPSLNFIRLLRVVITPSVTTLLRGENDSKQSDEFQANANHDSYTFQAFKWTRIQVFHDNNRDFKSRTLFVGEERCPIALFESFGAKTSIKTSKRWSVFFCFSSKRKRKFKHLVQTKPKGENTITSIMKVSVAGTSLKESEKKSLRIIVREKQQSGSRRK